MLLALAALAAQPTCRDLALQQPRRAQPAATSGSIWDDVLMLPGQRIVCGAWKCYFPSVGTPGTGYLMFSRQEMAGDAWYFASCLQQRYGVRHSVAAPTVVANATDEMLSRLSKVHLTKSGTRKKRITSTSLLGSTLSGFRSGGTMWLQKVRQAPARKLFVACRCHKRRRTTRALPDFCASVTDKETFRRRVSSSMQARAALVGDRSRSAVWLSTLTHSLSQPLTRLGAHRGRVRQSVLGARLPGMGAYHPPTITTTTITITTTTTTPARDLYPGRASARTHFIDD